MIAYYLITGYHGPVGLIINLVVYLVLAIILFLILQWGAAELGVPPKIVQLIGILLFLLVILSVFAGCSTAHSRSISGYAKADRIGATYTVTY